MANSIIGSSNSGQNQTPATQGGLNPQMLQQLNTFKQTYKGNPKQAVMQMLQRGQITNPQLQQAMQMARQIQNLIK